MGLKRKARLGIAAIGVLIIIASLLTWDYFRGPKRWIKKLKDPDVRTRRQAVQKLREMGASAKEAIPALIEALKDDDEESFVQSGAAHALGAIGIESLPRLIPLLKSDDDKMRYLAAVAIGKIGEEAIPELRIALKDQSTEVRNGALEALRFMYTDGKKAIPDLIAATNDKEFEVRLAAFRALASVGPASLPYISESLRDVNPERRVMAAIGMRRSWSPNQQEAIPVLRAVLEDRNYWVRYHSALALVRCDEDAIETVEVLIEALQKDVNDEEAAEALWKIRKSGTDMKKAIPVLLVAYKNGKSLVRDYASDAILAIDQEAAIRAGIPLRD